MYQDKRERYIDLMGEAVRMAEKHGMNLLGGWHSVIGLADEITNLWGFKTFESWVESRQKLDANPQWQKVWAEIRPCVRYKTTTLLTPVCYSPDYTDEFQYQFYKGGIWLQAAIDVWPERLQRFYELMTPYMPRAKEVGMAIVGGYIAVVGKDYEHIDYWYYPDDAAFARYWIKPHLGIRDDELAELRQDRPAIRINQDHETYKVMRPLPYSRIYVEPENLSPHR